MKTKEFNELLIGYCDLNKKNHEKLKTHCWQCYQKKMFSSLPSIQLRKITDKKKMIAFFRTGF